VELLKETIPQLSRVAVLGTSTEPASLQSFREAEVVVKALGIQLRYFDVEHSSNIGSIFRDVTKERVDAVLVLSSPVLNSKRAEIAKLAIQSRLPSAFGRPEYVEAGGLMTYGPSLPEMFWRAATYVDKILKGAKPAALPVEQPTKFELVINLKAAKQIGVTIPPNVLARADKVIK
jgi:putative ABC transport system substrate-binding protein